MVINIGPRRIPNLCHISLYVLYIMPHPILNYLKLDQLEYNSYGGWNADVVDMKYWIYMSEY